MKDKFSGKILEGGLCICDVCGQKSKLGGFINPMSPNPQVVCYDCMIKASDEEKGISIAAAEKQRNSALRTTNLFIDHKMKEYRAIFVRIFTAGKFHLLSGGHIAYPPMYLNEKLKEILKAYRKSGRTDAVNSFLRHNGYIFGRLL